MARLDEKRKAATANDWKGKTTL